MLLSNFIKRGVLPVFAIDLGSDRISLHVGDLMIAQEYFCDKSLLEELILTESRNQSCISSNKFNVNALLHMIHNEYELQSQILSMALPENLLQQHSDKNVTG